MFGIGKVRSAFEYLRERLHEMAEDKIDGKICAEEIKGVLSQPHPERQELKDIKQNVTNIATAERTLVLYIKWPMAPTMKNETTICMDGEQISKAEVDKRKSSLINRLFLIKPAIPTKIGEVVKLNSMRIKLSKNDLYKDLSCVIGEGETGKSNENLLESLVSGRSETVAKEDGSAMFDFLFQDDSKQAHPDSIDEELPEGNAAASLFEYEEETENSDNGGD